MALSGPESALDTKGAVDVPEPPPTATWSTYRRTMSTEQMAHWWHQRTEDQKAAWLAVLDGLPMRVSDDLIATLPEDRRPGENGAWVTTHLLHWEDQPAPAPAFQLSDEFDAFLSAERERRWEEAET